MRTHASPGPAPGFREFVALIAILMALQALGIDAMLPALPTIGHALGVTSETRLQWIVATYIAGMGVGQLVWGILADRYGRRPIMLIGLALYLLAAALSALAQSEFTLLLFRFLHGAASASAVVCRSIVRDLYSGRRMARVMSLTFIVFLIVPVLAPSIGQLILVWLPWRWLFGCFALVAALMLLWATLRLPETLHPEYRLMITTGHILQSARVVLTDPLSIYHTLAMTLMFGWLIAYVASVQQIFADVFHRPELMPVMFALCASAMGVTSWLNSRLVERLGMRMIGHGALLAFIAIAALHWALARLGHESMLTFVILQGASLASLGMCSGNFGTIAMEPLAAIAGIGAALQGFISSVGAALIGALIGARFDGTTAPLSFGALIAGIAALLLVLVAEKGRLFRPHHADEIAAVAPLH
ncbi:MAG: MFS transporter [Gammaproteobacteria bacterium]|nr:MFS transporter [Gammaproteobacteria bacterium]